MKENKGEFESQKKLILAELRQIEVIQDQSINRFDAPEVHNRVFQLLDVLDSRLHEWNDLFENPTSEENHLLQNAFFQVNKMKETAKDLKINPQKFSSQQDFKNALESIQEDLHNLS